MLNSLSLNIDQNTQRMLRRLGWLGILFLLAVLVISAVERKEQSEAVETVVNIEPLMVGESLINEADIKLAITRNFGYQLQGRALASIDVERVEEVLESEPFILKADVYISANNVVQIDVIPREPILRVIDNSGRNYYLDNKGIKMPLSDHFTAKVLVATGSLPNYDDRFLERKRSRLKDAFELTQLIQQDEFLEPMIEQIHFESQGSITLIPKLGRHKVIFGKYEHAEDKLKKLKIFYKEALPHEGWRKYHTVDLSYKGQVVCKKR